MKWDGESWIERNVEGDLFSGSNPCLWTYKINLHRTARLPIDLCACNRLSLQGKKTCCGCWRERCYEDYLDLKRRKKRRTEEIAYWGASEFVLPPNIIMVIKSWRMIWIAHMELAVKILHSYGIPVGKPVSTSHVGGIHKRKENIRIFRRGCAIIGVNLLWIYNIFPSTQQYDNKYFFPI